MHRFKKLDVWQRSMRLTRQCYLQTYRFPKSEKYGLAAQIQRSAVSIPSNIAEGSGRGSDKEFARFLLIAHASGSELETQLLLARDLEYAPTGVTAELQAETIEIRRMLFALNERLVTPLRLDS